MSLTEIQQNPVLNAIVAPYLQPGAQYQQTQAQIPLTQQETQTSAQSAATSGQEQQNLQAQNPGEQAQSQQQQVAALQKKAQLGLASDLSNKMTLPSAMKKYTAFGMNSDDIFNQYLAESPWGIPHQTPEQLQQMGVSTKALGAIGTPGSFMDRYNTKNAVEELRNAQDLWNQTSTAAKLPFLSGFTKSAGAYNSSKEIVGEHLSSLIPGGSSAASSVNGLLNTLPDTGNLQSDVPGKAQAQFDAVEKQLLASKGYSLKDLGIAPTPTTQQAPKGGDVLTKILGSVVNPQIDTANKMMQDTASTNNSINTKGNLGASTLKSLFETGNAAVNATRAIPSDINTALDIEGAKALPGLVKSGTTTLSQVFGKGSPIAEKTLADAPGGIKQLLQPGQAMKTIGNIRDNLITVADKTGATVDGNNLAQNIRSWANTAKLSNLPDADAIETAAQKAETLYKDQTFKPSQIKNIYDGIEKGFTTTSQPKSSTASYIDRGLQSVLSDTLDEVAPGFKQTSKLFESTYNAAKSPLRTGVKNLAKFGLAVGLPTAAADTISHAVFGH